MTEPSSRRATIGKLFLEVALISGGVFLGLAGDQWRENTEHRALARATLERLRAEMVTNRDAVRAVSDYHATTLAALRAYFAGGEQRKTASVNIRGLQPVAFERTAWDLALTTQALAHIDDDLAFAIARVYNTQNMYASLTAGITQAMYVVPFRQNFDAFASATETYFSDLVLLEPKLTAMYDDLMPRIDRTVGASGPR
jgi:hypothetical protein